MALGMVPESPYVFIASTSCELVVTLFIACAVVLFRSEATPAYSVYIAAPRFTFAPSAARLHAICGPTSLACTAIRGTYFHATCDESSDGWHAHLDACFIAYTS